MNGPRRLIITGVAAAGVLVTGGVAVATGLAAASASSTSAQPSVADLQARLAQLQSDTSSLTSQVTDAQKALTDAQAAQALADANAAAAATAAANLRPAAPQHVAPTHVAVKAAHKLSWEEPNVDAIIARLPRGAGVIYRALGAPDAEAPGLPQGLPDGGLGADVDAAGGLRGDQHGGVGDHLAADDELLLVAARQGVGGHVDAGRADVELLDDGLRSPPSGPLVDEQASGERG